MGSQGNTRVASADGSASRRPRRPAIHPTPAATTIHPQGGSIAPALDPRPEGGVGEAGGALAGLGSDDSESAALDGVSAGADASENGDAIPASASPMVSVA